MRKVQRRRAAESLRHLCREKEMGIQENSQDQFSQKKKQTCSKEVIWGLNPFLQKNSFQEKDSAKTVTEICLTLRKGNTSCKGEWMCPERATPTNIPSHAAVWKQEPGKSTWGQGKARAGKVSPVLRWRRWKKHRESKGIIGGKDLSTREVTNRKSDFSNSYWLEVSLLARQEGQNGWEAPNEKMKWLEKAYPVWDRSLCPTVKWKRSI